MEDLSHLFAGGPISALTPTAQSAGNMTSSNAAAHTAPGSPPVDPMPPAEKQADPAITAEAHVSPVLLDQGGAAVNPDNADRSAPFAGDSSGGWASKPILQRGGWNDMGGGPAPEGR